MIDLNLLFHNLALSIQAKIKTVKNFQFVFDFQQIQKPEQKQKRGEQNIKKDELLNVIFQKMDKGAEKRKNNPLKIELKSTQGLNMTTVNPCNDFLVDFLIASKLKSEKQGIGKFTTYNLAIESVRKYPLPLICQAQLAALEGFGDFFINEGAKRIQKHYRRGRLPTQAQMIQDDQQHFEALQANRRKGYRKKNAKTSEDDSSADSQEQNEESSEGHKQQEKVDIENNKNSSQNNEVNNGKKERNPNYKPHEESEIEKILKSMLHLNAVQNPVSKGQISDAYFKLYHDSIKSWEFNRSKLLKYRYIEDGIKQNNMYRLTDKGYSFTLRRAKKQSKNKEAEKNKLIKVEELTIVVHMKILAEQEFQDEKVSKVLNELGGHKLSYENSQAGSFLWKICNKFISNIVVRLELDQQNATDGQFESELLVNCGVARLCSRNAIILIETSMSLDTIKQMEISSTIYYCMAAGCKFIFSKSFKQSLMIVSELTAEIKERLKAIKSIDQADVIGSASEFETKINKVKKLSTFFQRCLTILGLSKQASSQMKITFGTFIRFLEKVKQKFEGEDKRQKIARMLSKLLQDKNTTREQINTVIDFFYSDNYN